MSDADSAIDPVAALAEDFVARYRRGERPALAEYTRQYPELAERIRQIFPLMALMEEAAPASEGSVAAAPARPAATTQPRPQQLGGYRILREIGRGGMGVVYEAEQLALRRRVALKVLPLHASREGKSLERFRREARAAARLHHTNIVPVYEVGEEDDICFYAMQYIDGQPLDQVVEELRAVRQTQVPDATRGDQPADANRTLRRAVVRSLWDGTATIAAPAAGGDQSLQATEFSLGPSAAGESALASGPETSAILHTSPWHYHRNVARIGMEVAQALAYAHRDGVVHRDVKPSNLLLDSAGRVWITDFGLAKTDAEPLTGTGDLLGTLRYMPPERFRGWSDPRSDVYSLGLTLYEMLLLRPAFAENDQARLMQQIVNVEPPRLGKVDRHVPRDLATIVTKAIDKEPSRRYQTAGELAGDLQRFLEDRPILARQSGVVERSWRWCRRHRAVASLAGSVLLLLVVIAAGASLSNLKMAGALQDVSNAEREARVKLFSAYRGQIRGSRFSRQVGQRFETLATIEKAVALARELKLPQETLDELRTDAIAALTLPDLRPAPEWTRAPADAADMYHQSDFAPNFRLYALPCPGEGVRIYKVDADRDAAVELGVAPMPAPFAEPQVERRVMPHWSRDGRFLALIGPSDVRVLKIDVDAGQLRSAVVVAGPLAADYYQQTVAFSPDSRRFAFLHGDGSLHLHDLTGPDQPPRQLKVAAGSDRMAHHPRLPQAALDSPTGIHVLDLTTGAEVAHLRETQRASALAWHPDGERLAVGRASTIRIWDVPRRRPTWEMDHKGGGLILAFSQSGDLLASNTWAGRFRLWDPAAGLELLRLTATRHFGHYPRFGADNRIAVDFAEAGGGTFRRLAQVETPRELRIVRAGASIGGARNYCCAALHPAGRLLAVGTEKGISLIDAATGNEEAFLPVGGTAGVLFEPSGSLLTKIYGHGVLRWPVEAMDDMGVLRVGPAEKLPIPAPGDYLAASRDGKVLAVSHGDGAYVWRRDKPGQGLEMKPHFDCRQMSVSPDGRLVATISFHGPGVKVWDAQTGRLIDDLVPERNSGSVYFTGDGRRLVTSHGKCWRVPAPPDDVGGGWAEAAPLPEGVVAAAPDRPMLAVVGPHGEIRLVHSETGRVLARLENPQQHAPYSVTFSADGTRLVVPTNEGLCVHLWDLREIRRQLAPLDLDWNGPEYPAPSAAPGPKRIRVEVSLGSLPGAEFTQRLRQYLGAFLPSIDWQRGMKPVGAAPVKNSAEAAAHFERGMTHYDRGLKKQAIEEFKQAIEEFTQALRADRDHVEAFHYRGHAYERLNQPAKARDDFTEAIKRRPTAHLYARRGLAHKRLGDYALARGDLDRGRADQSDEPAVRHALAWIHVFGPADLRDASKAVFEAELAFDLATKRPAYADVLPGYGDTVGAAHYRAGNYEKAAQVLSRADAAPKPAPSAVNRFFLAMSRRRLGQTEQAQTCYQQALAWLKTHPKLPRPQLERLEALRAEAAALLDAKSPK